MISAIRLFLSVLVSSAPIACLIGNGDLGDCFYFGVRGRAGRARSSGWAEQGRVGQSVLADLVRVQSHIKWTSM
eukprot:scaffold18805_cov95-Cyclotella_meneghiniana.AAC.9